ncbi:phosphotransferase [Phytoactinopolyspora halophila]|uniref:phosphotransferase n=1 Tax=Phytoactinopolyspora halophila TaxID=1981511 RepID=UPI001B8C3167|nr:phosphotransferase [Phytoactinopolyspora halophila]
MSDHERVRAWVHEDFGIELENLDLVGAGADLAAQTWCGSAPDGEKYAVKWSGGRTPTGLLLSAHLARYGVSGVAAPVPTLAEGLWSSRAGRRLSVVPWVSDVGALDTEMTAAHWGSYGELLSEVHRTPVTDAVAELLPHEDYTHDRWSTAVRGLHRRLNTPDHEAMEPPTSDDHLTHSLAGAWHDAADLIMTLLDHADQLGETLRGTPAPRVICHGDAHLGNVLIDQHAGTWLIDWDDAVIAPAERDLMFVVGGGVLPFAPVSEHERSWFFDGYGAAEIDPARLAYYQCTRALEDLAETAEQTIDAERYTDDERADALALFHGVLAPTGLARFALASLHELGLTSTTI